MKPEHWIILIGTIAWGFLYLTGYISHGIGNFVSDLFRGTVLEQTGTAITTLGDTAFTAFWMILAMALIVTLGVIYIRVRTTS